MKLSPLLMLSLLVMLVAAFAAFMFDMPTLAALIAFATMVTGQYLVYQNHYITMLSKVVELDKKHTATVHELIDINNMLSKTHTDKTAFYLEDMTTEEIELVKEAIKHHRINKLDLEVAERIRETSKRMDENDAVRVARIVSGPAFTRPVPVIAPEQLALYDEFANQVNAANGYDYEEELQKAINDRRDGK